MVHAVDEFGTPPPSPPPKPSASSLKADRDRAARAAEAARAKSNVKKADLEKSLKRLELAMAQKTAPKSDELTEMLATCEKLFRDARSEDVTFEQRQRLKAIEEQIQKAHKGTMLAQKLAEGEYLMRTGGAPEELRSKMGEIERAIKEAGPQINNHPHIKDQLEKQLDEIDKRLEERKRADQDRQRQERERREVERRDDPLRRDRERARVAAQRRDDIRGPDPPDNGPGPGGGPPGGEEVRLLREKIDRMQREGGDELVLSALREKLSRLENVGQAAPPGNRRGPPREDDVGDEKDEDGDGEPETVVVGRRKKRSGKRIRGIFRGGASADAKADDEVEVRPSRSGRGRKSFEDDDEDDQEIVIIKRPKKKDGGS